MIRKSIDSVFSTYKGIPLFYIESGSRLWQMASVDSDYDVRGFHLQIKEQYYDYKSHRDIIEVMDADFDFVSFDLDKAFKLLVKSNPSLYEWIRSEIVYYNVLPDWKSFKLELSTCINYQALYHHYTSMAKQVIHSKELETSFTYKKLLYAIRGILSASLAIKQQTPPLDINILFDSASDLNTIVELGRMALEKKIHQDEKTCIDITEQKPILQLLQSEISALDAAEVTASGDFLKLSTLLSEYTISLKNFYYT